MYKITTNKTATVYANIAASSNGSNIQRANTNKTTIVDENNARRALVNVAATAKTIVMGKKRKEKE